MNYNLVGGILLKLFSSNVSINMLQTERLLKVAGITRPILVSVELTNILNISPTMRHLKAPLYLQKIFFIPLNGVCGQILSVNYTSMQMIILTTTLIALSVLSFQNANSSRLYDVGVQTSAFPAAAHMPRGLFCSLA